VIERDHLAEPARGVVQLGRLLHRSLRGHYPDRF
jgi:hypothetical protein